MNTYFTRLFALKASSILGMIVLFFMGSDALRAQTVTVTNTFEQHYRYSPNFTPSNAPAGPNCTGITKIPSGQYPSTYHLETSATLHHYDPNNAANDYYVIFAHFENSNYTIAEQAVFKSTSPCGPFMLQTNLYTGTTASNTTDPGATLNADGAGYGFRPGGWQARDSTAWQEDASTQTYNPDGSVSHYANAYIYVASNSLNTLSPACSYANDTIAGFRLTQDYLGIDYTTSPSTNGANWISPCQQREGPVMFKNGNYYFLITSQAAGWYPSQAKYASSTDPLTGFPAVPVNLGNGSAYGGQSSGSTVIKGSQSTTYMLTLNHLGGSDSKNPANAGSGTDSGSMFLPVLLNGTTGVASMPWSPSWTVDVQTGVLTLPTLTNLATSGAAAASTVTSAATSGSTTYVPGNAIDGSYATRWTGSSTGSGAFTAAKPTTSTLCPVTNATTNTTCNPSLIVDIGSVQPVQELDLSSYMISGSEEYLTYKIAYSSDNVNWTTLDTSAFASAANATASNIGAIPFVTPITYGFNFIPVNFSARYVALIETSSVQQNTTTTSYGPNAYELAVIKSTAPSSPQPVTVNVTPSASSVPASSAFTVAVNVVDPSGTSTPSGYIQLSTANFTSDTYALLQGLNTINVPAGAVPGGNQTLTVTYRADPTGAPIYGIANTTGTASITIAAPAAPTNATATAVSPGAIGVTWSAVNGATGYVLSRSTGGGSYSQIATPTTNSFTDTGLTNGQQYCYTVASSNAAGAGTPSTPTCATVTNNFPVTGITVTSGVSGPGSLLVSYNAVANTTGYIIKRSVNGAPYATIASPTTTSYIDSGLAAGSKDCYTVAANFSTGSGADSSPVCASPSTATPPLALSVTPWASGQLYLSWQVNGSASSYTIKRSVNGAAFTTLVSSQTALYYIDTSLTNGTKYCYTVSETLSGVTSPDSGAVCTLPIGTYVTVGNYSFELPSVGLWSTTSSYLNANQSSWTFTSSTTGNSGNNGGVSNTSGTFTSSNTPVVPLGSQVGLLEGTGSITQTISGLTAGATYDIIVSASQRQASGYQVGGPEPFTVSMGGTLLATFTPPQVVGYYRDYVTSFTASSTSATLALAGTGGTAAAVLLDNVRIFATANTSQTINFTQPASPAYVGNQATLTATGGASGNSVVFSIVSGPATLSGVNNATITYTGAGTVVIAANQTGGSSYAAAAQVTQSVTVQNQSVFVTNSGGSMTSFLNSGALQSGSTAGGGVGAAVDAVGNVWSINTNGNSVSLFSDAGSAGAMYSGAGMNGATALAIDGNGIVWIANGNGTISALTSAGAAALSTPVAAAGQLGAPASITVSSSGSLWLANSGGNTITEVVGAATPVMTPVIQQTVHATPATEP